MIITETKRDSPARLALLKDYANRNSNYILDADEVVHIATCLEHLLDWYETGRPLGDFLTNLLKNDLKNTIFSADDINRKALPVYAFFLHWQLPGDYRERAKSL